MRTIIAGSRGITSLPLITEIIESSNIPITEVICGGARGVDSLGRKWAGNGNRIPVKLFTPKWDEFGKSAGYRRNLEMADNADALIAIWDGESRGTNHMINIAKERGLKVAVAIVSGDSYYWRND